MTDADWIQNVVTAFYDKAKTDVLIGYHFRIITDFDAHIPRISAFWELQLLGRTQKILAEPFDVMKAHVSLGIKRGELGRWLVLFRKTLDEEVKTQPEFAGLMDLWLEKLGFFEGVFLRYFRFK